MTANPNHYLLDPESGTTVEFDVATMRALRQAFGLSLMGVKKAFDVADTLPDKDILVGIGTVDAVTFAVNVRPPERRLSFNENHGRSWAESIRADRNWITKNNLLEVVHLPSLDAPAP